MKLYGEIVPSDAPLTRGIKDVFYETRVLMGRGFTLRRFAQEVLGGSIDTVTLSCIESGTRFPSEATVRRLAAVRKQDPHELLVLLWRDRMVYAFARELDKVLHAPRGVAGIEDAELAVALSQAIAALPLDGGWVRVSAWRKAYQQHPKRTRRAREAVSVPSKQVEALLIERKLVEVRGAEVRRKASHFVARGAEEQKSLVLEFCALFTKSVLDKLALPGTDTGTYLRNHYLDIPAEKTSELQHELEEALQRITKKYAVEPAAGTKFLNVLVASTPS